MLLTRAEHPKSSRVAQLQDEFHRFDIQHTRLPELNAESVPDLIFYTDIKYTT